MSMATQQTERHELKESGDTHNVFTCVKCGAQCVKGFEAELDAIECR